ncbi:5'/3'-nucleotidase SurE [Pseudooceanicola aestuarii]|uniref:5'/3'-nucleotidase SurE n=1 Tax=Pseudooceanicola aestuarii TaxID=2697319 RepID=UPI0013D72590|nr:5'/3'-nucleotidase SurE [Pseudooceanicola aestuarii]
MRILITNDDGISAPGLEALTEIATELAGPDGEVWTVAPAFEQSGVAHKISYTHPMMITQLGERRFAAEGSPADCVMAGLHDVLKGRKVDLVLSGVNRGNNSAENALYSGTLGGAMEAALQGLPAMALSQYLGPDVFNLDDPFEAARRHGAALVRDLLKAQPEDNGQFRLFHNINFPPVPATGVKGRRVVRQGYRSDSSFSTVSHLSPSGKKFLYITGGDQNIRTGADTDAQANLDGYISVTPMRADLTAHDMLEPLKAIE